MDTPITPEAKLEALLFWKGEPLSKKKLIALLGCSQSELEASITALESNLAARGLRLMSVGDEVELRTAPEAGSFLAKLAKEELSRDIGKAGLETLSIILYKGPVRRSEIDYIRGVNSSFIVRNLLIRGLIERVSDKEGQPAQIGRGYSYNPTIDLLATLGVAKIDDLPEYAKVKAELDAFGAAEAEGEKESAIETIEESKEAKAVE